MLAFRSFYAKALPKPWRLEEDSLRLEQLDWDQLNPQFEKHLAELTKIIVRRLGDGWLGNT